MAILAFLALVPAAAHANRSENDFRYGLLLDDLDSAELSDPYAGLAEDYSALYGRARALERRIDKASDWVVSRISFCLEYQDAGHRHMSAPRADAHWRSTPLKNHVSLAALNDESLTQWAMISDYCAGRKNTVLGRVPNRADAKSAAADLQLVALHAMEDVLDAGLEPTPVLRAEAANDSSDSKVVPYDMRDQGSKAQTTGFRPAQ